MWKWIVGSIVVIVAFFMFRVVSGIRRSLKVGNEQLSEALLDLGPEDLPALISECQEFFRSAFGVGLDPERWQESTAAIDDVLKDREKRRELLRGLHKENNVHYWVLPTGAFLGHLLERNASGHWQFNTDANPAMEIPAGGGAMTLSPFDKVLKHVWQGEPGDLVAYVNTNMNLDRLVAQFDQLEDQSDNS